MDLESLLYEIDTTKTIENSSEVSRAMNDVASETRRLCMVLNTGVYTDAEIREQFSHIIGKTVDSEFRLSLPFTTDFGKNIIVGKKVFINSGCRFQDQGKIEIGDNSFVGHNVVIATINHDFKPARRGTLHLQPVKLESNTWIGSNSTILPGVTVGKNAVVAAGSIVTKSVPANTVVAGNPAKVIKHLIN
ncbi:DapH/DapD/GlmU-related protein [Staphylococcus haemolyticus]|uniref:DapH/DapD/GlmU-related protein n=1 Tax=Staphylococcus haemolyticus TaxID=1283 RepID=UPI00187A3FE9|nr:DapH/DapD/GlmU-related protein [Staphylococcus haemolyticus]MBE7342445.1 sugar O-acetyltransferase [Staphylococcus haemolyticus]